LLERGSVRNENVKIVFRAYLRQKWIDLRQTKTKMISDPLDAYRGRRLHQQNCFIFSRPPYWRSRLCYNVASIILSVCLWCYVLWLNGAS